MTRGASPGVRVLAYHGLVEQRRDLRLERNFHLVDEFREQVRLLRRLKVLSLPELRGLVDGTAKAGSEMAVAITFDDGYLNNLVAAEILSAERLPWTIFVSTAPAETGSPIWTVELGLIVLRGAVRSLQALGKTWRLATRSAREAAFQEIRTALKGVGAPQRKSAMDELRAQLSTGEVQRLLAEFPAFRPLSWAHVAELASAGVEIGSHGVQHELHHAAQPESVRREELMLSKTVIAQRTGRVCRYFSFPNGATVVTSANEAQAAGYQLAISTRAGVVDVGDDPYMVPRTDPGANARTLARALREAPSRKRQQEDGE